MSYKRVDACWLSLGLVKYQRDSRLSFKAVSLQGIRCQTEKKDLFCHPHVISQSGSTSLWEYMINGSMETWTHFHFLWSLACVFDNRPITHFALSCPFCLSLGTVLRIRSSAAWGWGYSFPGPLSPITTDLVAWNNKNLFFQFWRQEVLQSVYQRGCFPSGGSEGNVSSLLLSQPLLLAGIPWRSQGCRPVTPSCASLCISPCLISSPKDTTPVGFRGHPTVV